MERRICFTVVMYHVCTTLLKELWRSVLQVVREAMLVVRIFFTFLNMGFVEDPTVTAAMGRARTATHRSWARRCRSHFGYDGPAVFEFRIFELSMLIA